VILALLLAAILFAAPWCAYRVMVGWPLEIRERMLLGLAYAAVLAMGLLVEVGPAILLGIAVWRWRGIETLPAVMVLLGVCGVYAAVKLGPPEMDAVLLTAVILVGTWQALLGISQYLRGKLLGWNFHTVNESTHGTLGNRVVLATCCALVAPLAPLWLLPVLLIALLCTACYTSLVAVVVGLLVAHPAWALPAGIALAPATAWVIYWRGHPRDSLRGRRQVAELVLANLWIKRPWSVRLFGHGHGAFRRYAQWWTVYSATGQHYRQAHNDLLHLAFEYGLVGVAAVLLWVVSLSRGMALGDPLTGALAAGAVSSMAQFPAYLPQVALLMLAVAGLLARRTVAG
jgi:hypothetical protein